MASFGLAARAALALLISTTGLISSAFAQVEIPSPYLDWTAGFDGSAAPSGPVPRWNVNACTNAYEKQRKIDEIEGLRERTREIVDSYAYATDAEKAKAHADAAASLQDDVDLFLAEAAPVMAVLPHCNGLYLRSELELSCPDQPDDRVGICAALDGRGTEDVIITEDEAAFRVALARRFLGELEQRGNVARVSRFAIGRQRMWFEGPPCRKDGGTSEHEPLTDSDRRLAAWIFAQDRIEKEAFGLYSLGGTGTEPDCQERVGIGAWAFGFRTELFDQGGYSEEDLLIDPDTLAAAKLEPRVGPFWQQPRLEINLGVPPVLLLEPEAQLHVELHDGKHIPLSAAALQLDPDHVAFYDDKSNRTSWFSLYPQVADWQALLNPEAAFLVGSFTVAGADGGEQTLLLRSPLDGFASALDSYAAKRREISDQYDASIASLDDEQ